MACWRGVVVVSGDVIISVAALPAFCDHQRSSFRECGLRKQQRRPSASWRRAPRRLARRQPSRPSPCLRGYVTIGGETWAGRSGLLPRAWFIVHLFFLAARPVPHHRSRAGVRRLEGPGQNLHQPVRRRGTCQCALVLTVVDTLLDSGPFLLLLFHSPLCRTGGCRAR